MKVDKSRQYYLLLTNLCFCDGRKVRIQIVNNPFNGTRKGDSMNK